MIETDEAGIRDALLRQVKSDSFAVNSRGQWFQPGEIIFRQGQAVETIFVIESGVLSLTRITACGKVHRQGDFAENGFLGLLETFSGKPCFYTATAKTVVSARAFPAAEFKQQIIADPVLAELALRNVTVKWYRGLSRMTDNILLSLRHNMVQGFCDYANAGVFTFTLNKSAQAERLGTSVRVYNRVLKTLEDEGRVVYCKRHLTVLDLPALQAELQR